MNQQQENWIENAVEQLMDKLSWVSERSKTKIPYTTINNVHDDKSRPDGSFSPDDGINWWCNGFWAGMMWQMYHATGNNSYRDIARITEEKLDQCFVDFYGLHHDVGFMYLPSAVADYRLTQNKDSRKRGLHAATLLAGRFNPVGQFIRAWNDIPDSNDDTRGWAIIDCLFNIPLLYWAGDETKDPRFTQIATLHADTVMKCFVRTDGSVRHIVEFDPFTGEMVRDHGGQGYGQGSSWTRGQAWGLYGFLISWRHTGKMEYFDTAKRIAHYFIANIPKNGLIPVDFRQPESPWWYDDTAAAIAACGLIEIAREVGELERNLYHSAALRLLKALYEEHCDFSRDNDCILTKCTGSYHNLRDHEITMIYGDYFFTEAMFKLKETEVFLW